MTTRQPHRVRRTRRQAVLVVLATAAAAVLGVATPSSADVSEVQGSAFGYYSEVSLFGGPSNRRGFGQTTTPGCNVSDPKCAPTTAESPSVELPPTGGSESATDPDGATARYGPATIFSSGAQDVTSQGTTGPGGSVITTATINAINTSQQEVFTADRASSTVTASEAGVSGAAEIINGTVQTSEGSCDVEGDETIVPVPANPEPNTVITGQLECVGDSFRWVFNEQVTNPDGSLTVYAAHMELLGPTAVGNLFIGKSTSGVTSDGNTTTPTTATEDTTTTTAAGGEDPPPVVPESPLPFLLPLGAIGIFGGAAAFASRRRKNSQN